MRRESAFTMDTSSIKYGPGATREIGHDVGQWGARRVMVVTDPNLAGTEPVSLVLDALREARIDAVLFDQVEVEPTDRSFQAAIAFAVEGRFDGYVAVGGGSSIDTAKAADLYATYPAELLDYVNPPVGKGLPVPGKLKPLVAVPTTAGTGSETTGVAIFDYTPLHAKTGIAQPRTAAGAGSGRSQQYPRRAPAGRRVHGTGRSEPCRRIPDRLAVLPAARPGQSRPTAGIPRVQPDQRHLGQTGDRDGRALSGPVDD